MSTAAAIPQSRPLSDSEVEGPVLKKPRLDKEILVEEKAATPDALETVLKEDSEVVVPLEDAQPRHGKVAKHKKKKRKEPPLPEPCSAADVLYQEIRALLGEDVVDEVTKSGGAFQPPFEYGEELVVKIENIGSGGSGIALAPQEKGPWAVVVPFALSGETARVRIVKSDRMHSIATPLEILTKNAELRNDSRVQCKYFGSCGGCQYQMLSGETQLNLKRDVIIRAFKIYSKLPESSVPEIGSTVESPLVYAYRTKITPHFERPPKWAKKNEVKPGEQPPWLKIGFNMTSSNSTMDIEECPISTPILNERYKSDRKDIIQNIFSYKKGVSLMYRDSLDPSFDAEKMMSPPIDKLSEAFTRHVCITDQKGSAREMVGDYLFEYNAGGFFQNNNSVLPLLVDYVRDLISTMEYPATSGHPTHLVDTYCGAGLFAISLASAFNKVAGIELSQSSIKSAKRNAKLNSIPDEKISFLSGEAQNIFAAVKDFPADKTVVVIDPPRKGCDDLFLKQLLQFRPSTVVYISCNVHTQARDVGVIVRETEKDDEGRRYKLESLRGFDLFPQTAHVESAALLRLY
ncbi:S-adenosyl-L-methionine-dependent methyltransferase [Gymnopilus junonius]|uniref:S-adenosyl-L-methionine-dependent methyltransferase n=1 Tax=Gymnopilus junonius TaxID=109634 RepID=A0A9P5N7T9_GYMJU|nr:S-adenosyl-L-methionine-dependent methyltransferase [Gymnopilus junonius]